MILFFFGLIRRLFFFGNRSHPNFRRRKKKREKKSSTIGRGDIKSPQELTNFTTNHYKLSGGLVDFTNNLHLSYWTILPPNSKMDQRERTMMVQNQVAGDRDKHAQHHVRKHPPHTAPKPGSHAHHEHRPSQPHSLSVSQGHGHQQGGTGEQKTPPNHKKKPGGLVSEGSWTNFLQKPKKNKVAVVETPMSPYDIHDGHDAKVSNNAVNEEGNYFVEGGKHHKANSPFRGMRSMSSSSFNVSAGTQARQEHEMYRQILAALFFISIFFGVIAYIAYDFFKDIDVTTNGFYGIISGVILVLIICKGYYDKGYNICELFGGRPGGAVG